MADTVALRVIQKIADVARERWDALAGGAATPFLKWDWLESLERSGCVNEKSGWLPHHIVVEKGGELVAACPMYLKLHSMGEFVFDYEWAEAAHRAGIQYYPKMLVGIPFTPVTGNRFLTVDGEERGQLIQFMGQALAKIAADNKISSVHVNFCLADEREALAAVGFFPRNGIQYHWQNRRFNSFDDYLASFRSDRRNKVKRERREVTQRGITIRAYEGAELTRDHLRTMFRLYKGHVDRLYYGRQYLTREFFDELHQRFAANLSLMLAEREGKIIAGTFNVRDDKAMYGRYWGCSDARGNKILGVSLNLLANPTAEVLGGSAGAVPQADPQGNRADVQVLILQHLDGADDFLGTEHNILKILYSPAETPSITLSICF